jgi:hypothetical protein
VDLCPDPGSQSRADPQPDWELERLPLSDAATSVAQRFLYDLKRNLHSVGWHACCAKTVHHQRDYYGPDNHRF